MRAWGPPLRVLGLKRLARLARCAGVRPRLVASYAALFLVCLLPLLQRQSCVVKQSTGGPPECGFPGIMRDTCEAAGCCFAGSQVARLGASPCVAVDDGFPDYQATAGVCQRPLALDTGCGAETTTEGECLLQGCCYSPHQSPKCFFPIPASRAPRNASTGPLVSIVVPCYKQEMYICSALDSVLHQRYTNWELLVVDDGTPGWVCAQAARDKLAGVYPPPGQRVVVLEKPNGGLSDARNFAIAHTRGTYLAMLDADDILWPGYLANVAAAVAREPDLDLLYADQAFFGTHGAHPVWYLVPTLTLDYASKRGPLPVISVYSRRMYDRVRGYRIDMIYGNEDYVYWLDMVQAGVKSRKVAGISSWYRLKEESMRTDPGYVSLAPAMTVTHNPLLYGQQSPPRVCAQLAEIFCKMHEARDAVRLQEATLKQPFSCYGWLWLALFKLHSGCDREALSVVQDGLAACFGPDASGSTNAHVAQLLLLHAFLQSKQSTSSARYAARLHDDCVATRTAHSCHKCASTFVDLLDCEAELRTILQSATVVPRPATEHGSPLALLRPDASQPLVEQLRPVVESALRQAPLNTSVPPNIHFVYGLGHEQAPQLHMYHYIALRSAFEVNRPATVFFHYFHEPRGRWWEQALQFVTPIQHPPFSEFQGRCVAHHAHKADVLRLRVLHDYGGVYMDMDTVSLRPWRALFGHEFVMGWQDSPSGGTVRQGKTYGLCNAAMVSAKHSRFSALWLQTYALFRSNGRDQFWDEHSVILPANLTEAFPDLVARGLIHTVSPGHMFTPLWTTVAQELLGSGAAHALNPLKEVLARYPQAFMLHLWVGGDSPHRGALEQLETSTHWLTTTRYGAIARQYVVQRRRTGGGYRYTPKPLPKGAVLR